MKRITIIFSVFIILLSGYSCDDKIVEANFEDMESMTIYDYLVENDSLYGTFLDVLLSGGIGKTLSAYNPYGEGYTLFLPDSTALQEFINNSDQYNTLQDLLDDTAYTAAMSRYHVVNLAINANDFPFGALPAYTLSEDFLTVSFVIEPDTAYYKINNQAAVIIENIELSNGYIHVIKSVLNPITFTTYSWISEHDGYSILKEAIDLTGFSTILDVNIKDELNELEPVTLLVEHDSIFNRNNILSIEDLIERVSPDDADYTNPENPLRNFVGYHILSGSYFLDDFADRKTNYTTYSEIPLNIDGEGLDLAINKGIFVFDTIINTPDTTLIDFVGFSYDASNVLTQSGAIHFIDQLMEQQPPSRARLWFGFWEEPLFNEFREEPGEYIIEDTASLRYITWSGTDLTFIKSSDADHPASEQDYIYLDGDFSVSYTVPKVVQGNYKIFLRVDLFNVANALVEVYVDGKKLGGLFDLSKGGSADNPYRNIELGSMNFSDYRNHTITVRSLIPGKFSWDQVYFEPVINQF